jgi:hypothetical protein
LIGFTAILCSYTFRGLGIENFAEYEQSVYDKYQEKAEREIVDKLNSILSSMEFVQILKARPQKKGKSPKRQKGTLRHLGLELLGIIKKISPALIETCVSMAILCPSFEVTAKALRSFGVEMNQNILQNLTQRFANLAVSVRVDCFTDEIWQKPGIKILICIDGGGSGNVVPSAANVKKSNLSALL